MKQIIGATSQVVSGIKYEVDIEVVKSICINSEKNKELTTITKKCPAKRHTKGKICKITIWLRLWLEKPNNLVVSYKCY